MRKRLSSASLTKMESSTTPPPPRPAKPPVVPCLSLLASLYYIAASVSLTLFNKLLFSRFPASDPPFLLLSQSITAVLILSILSLTGRTQLPHISKWSSASLRTYAPLFLSNLTMLLTSLVALKFTSLVMYNTLRRTSMIFVVSIHSYVNQTTPTVYTIVATMLVTLGALWAGTTDLAFDPVGYALAFTANLSTAVYLVLLRPIRDKLQISNLQLIFVNALANIPVLVILVITLPRKERLLSHFADLTYSFLFLCSCAMAVIINHAIFVNTTTNDAIAQSIASQLKDVVLLAASIVFVDDPAHRADGNLHGVMVGFLGSVTYGIGKIVGRRADASETTRNSLPKVAQHDQSKLSNEEKAELLGAETRPSS